MPEEDSAISTCCHSGIIFRLMKKWIILAVLILLGVSLYLMATAGTPSTLPSFKLVYSSMDVVIGNSSAEGEACARPSSSKSSEEKEEGTDLDESSSMANWTGRLNQIQANWPIKLGQYSSPVTEPVLTLRRFLWSLPENQPVPSSEMQDGEGVVKVLECPDLSLPHAVSQFLEICTSRDVSPAFLIDPHMLECLSQLGNSTCHADWTGSLGQVWFALSNHTKTLFVETICRDGGAFEDMCSIAPGVLTLELANVTVHIVDLEERPNYWYLPIFTGSDGAHAFLPFEVSVLMVRGAIVYIPSNISSFLSWHQMSRFRECNRTLAATVVPQYKGMTTVITQTQFEKMVYFRDLLYKAGTHPFLFSGTQLGWQRQCDIIPDTTDLDMAMRMEEYFDGLESLIIKDPVLQMLHVLGKPSDSLEMSVMAAGMKIDLFFLYTERDYSWVGGMYIPKRKKLKWTYPLPAGLCCAELRGHLFLVMCNFLGFIESNYGPDWRIPFHDAKFIWYNSHKNVQNNGYWSYSDWRNVYRTKFH